MHNNTLQERRITLVRHESTLKVFKLLPTTIIEDIYALTLALSLRTFSHLVAPIRTSRDQCSIEKRPNWDIWGLTTNQWWAKNKLQVFKLPYHKLHRDLVVGLKAHMPSNSQGSSYKTSYLQTTNFMGIWLLVLRLSHQSSHKHG